METVADGGSLSLDAHHVAIPVVEFHMMDKRKYFPLAAASGFMIRTILYPFTLIKTRLQIQKRRSAVYSGTFDAFRHIVKSEGPLGLYRGFWVSNLMVGSQMAYVTTYESVRRHLADNTPVTNSKQRSFIAGGCASLVSQTIVVPIDIVSQHLQMLGLRHTATSSSQAGSGRTSKPFSSLQLPPAALNSRLGAARAVVLAVKRRDGFRGFYQGYLASILTYAPGSAMWWFFYDCYCGGCHRSHCRFK